MGKRTPRRYVFVHGYICEWRETNWDSSSMTSRFTGVDTSWYVFLCHVRFPLARKLFSVCLFQVEQKHGFSFLSGMAGISWIYLKVSYNFVYVKSKMEVMHEPLA